MPGARPDKARQSLTRSFIVIPRHSRDGLKCKIKNVLKGGKETECGRADLCGELRHALAEQRRIDAQHAEKSGSIPIVQAPGYPTGAIGEGIKVARSAEGDVRLVLPPELGKAQVKKGEKVKVVRSYLRGSKGLFTEKGTYHSRPSSYHYEVYSAHCSRRIRQHDRLVSPHTGMRLVRRASVRAEPGHGVAVR